MMENSWLNDIDRLSEAANNLQKCLDCTICLELMTAPVKSRCGHSFCHSCIAKVLQKKNAHCPLCKANLKRRSISKDDHLETCIQKFQELITAIQSDCNIDILSHSKQPRNTRESCSNLNVSQYSDSNKRKLPKEQSSHQFNQSAFKVDRASTSRGKMTDCDARQNESNLTILPSSSKGHPYPADNEDNIFETADNKVLTWLHCLPDDINNLEDYKQPIKNEVILNDNDDINEKPDITCDTQEKLQEKQITDFVEESTSQANKKKKRTRCDGIKEINPTESGLKYNECLVRTRANATRNSKKLANVKKSSSNEIIDQRSLLSTKANEQIQHSTSDPSKLCTTGITVLDNKQCSMNINWSHMIKFGEEMRPKKKKVKKLNVSIEKNKNVPRIIEDIRLVPDNKCYPSTSTGNHNMSHKQLKKPNVIKESANVKDEIDKNLDSSDTEILSVSSSDVARDGSMKRSFTNDKANISMSDVNDVAAETSYIMLEEGERMRIKHLSNEQLNKILGFENVEKNSPLSNGANISDKNRHSGNVELLEEQKKLNMPQSQKLNRQEHETIRNVTPIANNFETTCPRDENRISEHRTNNSVQKISEMPTASDLHTSLTPSKIRLSLKKNTSGNKSVSSSLSNNSILDVRLSDQHNVEKDVSNYKNQESRFKQLSAVKHDLSSQLINVDQSKCQDKTPYSALFRQTTESDNITSETIRKERRSRYSIKSASSMLNKKAQKLVSFKQLGTLIRRRDVRYFYMGVTKREQLMPAKIQVVSVYNMQLINTFNEQNTMYRSYNLDICPCQSSTSQDSMNIIVLENTRCMDNLDMNRNVSGDAEVPSCFVNFPLSSTPNKDIDHHSNRTKTAAVEGLLSNTSQRSNRSIGDTEENMQSLRKTSYNDKNASEKRPLHSETMNTVKLLSPDKDSQLKFLAIDSPMSQNLKKSKCVMSMQRLKHSNKESNFSAIIDSRCTTNTPDFSTENSDFVPQFKSTNKRKKCINEFESHSTFQKNDDSSESDSDSSEHAIKPNKYNARSLNSNPGVNKKRRLSSSHNQDIEVTQLDHKKRDMRGKKFKRIISINSDTESESTADVPKNCKRNKDSDQCDYEKQMDVTSTSKKKYLLKQNLDEDLRIRNIVNKWNNEHNATQKLLTKETGKVQIGIKSTAYPSGEKSQQSTNIQHKEIQKSTSMTESDLFEHNSNNIYNIANFDDTVHQSTEPSKSEVSMKNSDNSNNDIINKVLDISRYTYNPNSCLRNDGRSQKDKNNKEQNLLQDNFDDIICKVEIPQSEDMISSTSCSNHDLNRTLMEQTISKCSAMMNEFCDVVRKKLQNDFGIIPASSIYEDNEYRSGSSRNVEKLPSTTTKSNISDKENIASHTYYHKKHDYMKEKDKKVVTLKNVVDSNNENKTVMLRNHMPYKNERSFDHVDLNRRLIDKGSNISTKYANDDDVQRTKTVSNESNLKDNTLEHNTLMNVTQDEAQLQIFEDELFGIATERNQEKTTKVTLQDDPFQKEQRTPKIRKQILHNKKTAEEYSGEEDDIVENTPETKTKNTGPRNIAMSHLSPPSRFADHMSDISSHQRQTPKSGTSMEQFKIYPLYQSTPKLTYNSTTSNRPDTSAENKNLKLAPGDAISLVNQVENKALENPHHHSDKRKLCFVCSGLTLTQITNVKQFAHKYNAEYMNQFDPKVTHVIVNTTGKENTTNSTLKYLQGIAHQKWVVGYNWVENCIKEQELLDEVPYEATAYNCGIKQAGPQNSRLRDKDLFEGFTFLCIGPYVNVSLSQYQDLLLATGATVVDSLEALANEKKGIKGIVIEANDLNDDNAIEHWYRTARAAPIMTDWIVECISQYKLVSLSPHIQGLSSQHFYAIGYPRELLEDEEYSDMSM